MENVLVNFRLPESRLELVRQRAARRRLTVSAYIRTCVEEDIARDKGAERPESGWERDLPAAVRDLIGLAEGAAVDDREARESYHDYLAEKYA